MASDKDEMSMRELSITMTPILTITGADNSGWSGLQLDLRVISEMGGHALTAATCIVYQDEHRIKDIHFLSAEIICKQVADVIASFHPQALKVGLINHADAVYALSREIVGCKRIVIAPGIIASNGEPLVDGDTIDAIKRYLIPMASLVVLRQVEAERLLGMSIATDEDMICAARALVTMGAEYVMLRGARITDGRLTALLYSEASSHFFSSYNIEGWQQHGVGGALSTAITTRLGMGDDVPAAIRHAHEYVHSRIVYSVKEEDRKLRPADIYNAFMNLLTDNYRTAHEVQYYASRLHITTRYLSQITNQTVSKAPKQIIAEYLLQEARQRLESSRLSVKEVSDGLGFSTTALFCKFFKQQMGQTPSEYRIINN